MLEVSTMDTGDDAGTAVMPYTGLSVLQQFMQCQHVLAVAAL